jgi:hypothetical protein
MATNAAQRVPDHLVPLIVAMAIGSGNPRSITQTWSGAAHLQGDP